ncbi:hypothetical protein, partial [Rhizobium sp.]|uniref:hypothetical protein n=1 Tax=Rhizobium sp. TaxID=391 RepID=UPI0028AAB9CF
MAKNMPVPKTRTLSGKTTIGNKSTQSQSIISNISKLLRDTIDREERYLKIGASTTSIHVPTQGLFDAANGFASSGGLRHAATISRLALIIENAHEGRRTWSRIA